MDIAIASKERLDMIGESFGIARKKWLVFKETDNKYRNRLKAFILNEIGYQITGTLMKGGF